MDSFGARSTLRVDDRDYEIFRLDALERAGMDVSRLPYSMRILLENLLRHEDGSTVTADDIRALAGWDPTADPDREISFMPARVLLQDFTGVPAIVDLAAMRDAMAELGGDPRKINPLQPVELVIDHSVQVDAFASDRAFDINEALDYERNGERYAFIKWGAQAFDNFVATPPNAGICHQVNLEYLARVVFGNAHDKRGESGLVQAYPDTLVGTDSHTPMVNGLGVLGWGVGGIEAEAAMLGQPIAMLMPQVIGFRLTGDLPEGATATDLVLTITEMLRRKGVVGRFVEFFGPGVGSLALADRATIGNMSPEYGSTCSIFPVDQVTLDYLRLTGRPEAQVRLVEAYMKEQGLFHTADSPEPVYTDTLELDLASVEPSISGPRRPQDRIALSRAGEAFRDALPDLLPPSADTDANAAQQQVECTIGDEKHALGHGAVVIAAITSCTNTSNPAVMVAAGLLAKKAADKGLARKPWVKTSLAPGSRVVTDYYRKAGLTPYLERLGFHTVGYGCTTCIGNSGPLPEEVAEAVEQGGLVAASVLSGNRNFEGRINPQVRANYLMSPPLVVAFALAGRIDIDLQNEPLATDGDGNPVYLKDIWPTQDEIRRTVADALGSEMFESIYSRIYQGDRRWSRLDAPAGERFEWDPQSTYVRRPTFFDGMSPDAPDTVDDIEGARCIALLGDSVTTDHISPAGAIKKDSPAGQYLVEHGVDPVDFNSYGSRRGNHEVMVRGTFANLRIRNRLVPGVEGGFTRYLPSDETLPIYDAAMKYLEEGTPLCVLAGKEYGSGSSRDWAAKGPYLQGIRFVIAESYERIHRSNLIGMGILPLQFAEGDSVQSLGLSGTEHFDVVGLSDGMNDRFRNRSAVTVRARGDNDEVREFETVVRLDTPQEILYYLNGGILQYVIRRLLSGGDRPQAESGGLAGKSRVQPRTRPRTDAVDEGSQESFPASDPPAY
jgi:aconitate hydratase